LNNIDIKESELDSFTNEYLLDLAIPSVVGFQGSLGAGKTTIIKNIIKNLGIEETVTSPTFNIVKNYKKDDLEVYHVDLYRISSIHEFYDLDLPLFKENTLFFIEWSDLLPTANLDNWRLIKIEVVDEKTRKISY
tara:strand:- start:2371 stop:2775 length:405 start_codon:yes stop_codon:yes gene_type:complete